ncbi:MAG TPA: TIGR04283 family arsenosugar biosynthesis glycosyltransferase [Candidatus Kapabacteria bacterium]|nr:TIGR04283 family arsenosugar biosynthesis glycosyltransferase [Candidatus Kapabacteria bacterium]
MNPEHEPIGDLSVVIPTLNEATAIEACIGSLRSIACQIIVADGGSADATAAIARSLGAAVVNAPAGRGSQLAAGAEAAAGGWILFLHADTRLTASARTALAEAVRTPGFSVGTFRLRFDRQRLLYRLYARLTRFDSLWTSFGDQGILIRRDLYTRIGGFDRWPLLEDVALLRRVRHIATIHSLPGEVVTSARRFERRGVIRQQLLNGVVLLRYLLGASPEVLAEFYDAKRAIPLRARAGMVVRPGARSALAHSWCVALLSGLVALHACGDGGNREQRAGGSAPQTAVREAGNAAEVQPGSSATGADGIQKQAEAALLMEPGLGGVRVTSLGRGVLRLHGTVGAESERNAAALTVRKIRGVDSVVNDITVRETPSH